MSDSSGKKTKSLGKVEDARNSRIIHTVELRRTQTEERMKRFRLTSSESMEDATVHQAAFDSSGSASHISSFLSDNLSAWGPAVAHFREILSSKEPPLDFLVDSGICPRLVSLLDVSTPEAILMDSLWAVTNVSAGTTQHTNTLLQCGGTIPTVLCLPHFHIETNQQSLIAMMMPPASLPCREQAAWALANIAGDGPNARDSVLAAGVIQPLLRLLDPTAGRQSTLRNCTWLMSNLCRFKPTPPIELLLPLLPTISTLLFYTDTDVVANLSGFSVSLVESYICDGGHAHIQAVLESGVCRRLVELSLNADDKIAAPVVRCAVSISAGDALQTEMIINCDMIPRLAVLARSPNAALRGNAFLIASNIAAGTKPQIEKLLSSDIMRLSLVHLREDTLKIQKECLFVITNACEESSPDQMQNLVTLGCTTSLAGALSLSDSHSVRIALQGLLRLLRYGESVLDAFRRNPVRLELEAGNFVSVIEDLQNHQDRAVYKAATDILSSFFEAVEDDDDDVGGI